MYLSCYKGVGVQNGGDVVAVEVDRIDGQVVGAVHVETKVKVETIIFAFKWQWQCRQNQ